MFSTRVLAKDLLKGMHLQAYGSFQVYVTDVCLLANHRFFHDLLDFDNCDQRTWKPDPTVNLMDNPLIFPDADFLADTWDFMPLDDRQTQQYEGDWSDATVG